MLTRPPLRMRGRHHGRTLEFRPPSPTDAPALIEAIESSLPELKPFMPFAHMDNTVEQQFERLVRVQRDYWAGGDMVVHVWDGERLVACTGTHQRTLNERGRELGYWVRSDYAGQGVGTFTTQAMVMLCFDHLGMERLQLLHNFDNHGSRRIAEKCGFHIEGTMVSFLTAPTPEMIAAGASTERASVMQALLRSEWPSLPWRSQVRQAVEVWDWQGTRVEGPS